MSDPRLLGRVKWRLEQAAVMAKSRGLSYEKYVQLVTEVTQASLEQHKEQISQLADPDVILNDAKFQEWVKAAWEKVQQTENN